MLKSSLGKKYVMGITGQLVCAFLVMHLAGNLALFAGKETFNKYAHMLEANKMLLYAAEAGLIGIFLLHILTAIRLSLGNRAARPEKYAVYKASGEKRMASGTMIFSGLVVLTFLVVHICQFKFTPRVGDTPTIYDVVQSYFAQPQWVIFYVSCIWVLSTHLFHGFQSSFQSLGLNHPRYTPMIKAGGALYAVTMCVGYTAIPIFMYLGKGG